MNRIESKFKELKRDKKKAFIAFITAGYPSLEITYRLVLEFAERGVDIIELGVPFSDPLADGPVIQESSRLALKKNTHLVDILKLAKRLRGRTQIPLCLMTYFNPVYCFGKKNFFRKAKECGIDGVIIPDLPPEEDRVFLRMANESGIDLISFLSPTSSPGRVKFIAKLSRGFIYYVSLTGVTGARNALAADLVKNIKLIKRTASQPVCVGFGVSSNAQVKKIYKIADGVIVGSAIIKKISQYAGSPDLVKKVGSFVSGLME